MVTLITSRWTMMGRYFVKLSKRFVWALVLGFLFGLVEVLFWARPHHIYLLLLGLSLMKHFLTQERKTVGTAVEITTK